MKWLVVLSLLGSLVTLSGLYLPLAKIGINLSLNTVFGAMAFGLAAVSLYLILADRDSVPYAG